MSRESKRGLSWLFSSLTNGFPTVCRLLLLYVVALQCFKCISLAMQYATVIHQFERPSFDRRVIYISCYRTIAVRRFTKLFDIIASTSQGRSHLGGLSAPKPKYSPPNEMKPMSPFGLGLFFLLDCLFKLTKKLSILFQY